MRIHIATDHAGLEFSTQLQHHLAAQGHEVVDHGPIDYDPLDDYPAFCVRAAQGVVADQAAGVPALGVVFGGSGNGEQIAANKVAGIRAATVHDVESARLSKAHNDANVLCFGERVINPEVAEEALRAWLDEDFEGGRHDARVAKLDAMGG